MERAPAPLPGGHAVDLRGVVREVVDRMGLSAEVRRSTVDERGVHFVDERGRPVEVFQPSCPRHDEHPQLDNRFPRSRIEYHRDGAYRGIRSHVKDYDLPTIRNYPFTPALCDPDKTDRLANIRNTAPMERH